MEIAIIEATRLVRVFGGYPCGTGRIRQKVQGKCQASYRYVFSGVAKMRTMDNSSGSTA